MFELFFGFVLLLLVLFLEGLSGGVGLLEVVLKVFFVLLNGKGMEKGGEKK